MRNARECIRRALTVLVLGLVPVLLLGAGTAMAADGPLPVGATVISSMKVKVVFDMPMAAEAAATSFYTIQPALGPGAGLSVLDAELVDGGYGVLLTTQQQRNGIPYRVMVSNAPAGDSLVSGEQIFLGTNLGEVAVDESGVVVHDDFNRPSGLLLIDLPIPGPWEESEINNGNVLELVSSPARFGAGALKALVSDTDPERDNALVRRFIWPNHEYYASALIYIPTQSWSGGQEVALLRLNEYLYTAHARLMARSTGSGDPELWVNWKSAPGTWAGPFKVSDTLEFDRWHWLQLHVRNSSFTGEPDGRIRVWVDDVPLYSNTAAEVARITMTYAEFGIMHAMTDGPAAQTITDEVRLGTSKQLPPVELTPPVTTGPTGAFWQDKTVRLGLKAVDDGVGVETTSWRIDEGAWSSGSRVALDLEDRTMDGRHTLSFFSTDFLGNQEPVKTASFGIDTGRPTTRALKAASVVRGKTVTLRYRVNDPKPSSGKATVTIRVKTRAGKTVLTLRPGVKATNRDLTAKAVIKLKRGEYRFQVYARDLAGNTQVKAGSARLRVR
jgi:hypothetical protein